MVEKKIECTNLSKVKYVRFGRLFIYVFVLLEKEDSRDIDPWWWRQWLWLRIGHSEGTWEDMSCCNREYKSFWLAVMVSDMARVRGKMCVTYRSTTKASSITINYYSHISQRRDHRWASYSLSRLPACWAPSDPHVSLDLRSVSHPPQVCTSLVSGDVSF